ncbi:uncharacterized protein cubi_02396 [Cryptosporidium ubiquitum]|uniref:Poly(A) RNA polymerase mitochondrial-like central palm domain-containing protein n=1 Tax=Cryptosporidium ubiquitum TaxID=857276 RepID=A0A1J4MJG7_9CRYT|nr:uncharacterized protein cubi_02396 [Cryptosporidium ubiquitum]OII73164.1 hypothetical protein cubi_02396 [Cryptosporidium ubiquitum]
MKAASASSLGRRVEYEAKEVNVPGNSRKGEQVGCNNVIYETKLSNKKSNNVLPNRKLKLDHCVLNGPENHSSIEVYKDIYESNSNCSINSDSAPKSNPKRVFEMIDRTLNTLLEKIVPSSKKKKEKMIILQCVELLVRETFGDSAKLFLTGSAAAEVDSEMSDVDLVVFTPLDSRLALTKIANQFKNIKKRHKEDCLRCKKHVGHQKIRSDIELTSECMEGHLCEMEVNVIATAKVPVMMLKSRYSKFKTECDVSVNMYTSLMHSILFQCVLYSYPELQPVLRLIKYWLHIRRLPVAKDGGLPCIVWLLLAIVHCSVNGNKSSRSQKEHLESICIPAKYMLSSLQVHSSGTSFQSTEFGSPSNSFQNGSLNTCEYRDCESKLLESELDHSLGLSTFKIENLSHSHLIERNKPFNHFNSNIINSKVPDIIDFGETGTTFMALVSFFTSLWNRSSLTCSVSVINKNVQPKDMKTVSQIIFNNGGIWDEILTLDDPSASLVRQLELLKCELDDFGFKNNLLAQILIPEDSSRVEKEHFHLEPREFEKRHELETSLANILPPSDCLMVSNLAARVTCGTWLVYLYELKRCHNILETYLQQIAIATNEVSEQELVSELFHPVNEEIYKIPAKLSTNTPICIHPCMDLDLIIEKDIIALVQVPYFEPNHKFCLVLIYGHLVIMRIENICVDWEGGWWSKEFLSRRDVRSVLHGSLFSPIPLSFSHLGNGGSACCILQPLDSRTINCFPGIDQTDFNSNEIVIDEVMVNPAVFITLLNDVEWYSVDDMNGFYIMPIKEYYRFLDMESIAKESPYWYENYLGKNNYLQPHVPSCRYCKKTSNSAGMEKILQYKSQFWAIKRKSIS